MRNAREKGGLPKNAFDDSHSIPACGHCSIESNAHLFHAVKKDETGVWSVLCQDVAHMRRGDESPGVGPGRCLGRSGSTDMHVVIRRIRGAETTGDLQNGMIFRCARVRPRCDRTVCASPTHQVVERLLFVTTCASSSRSFIEKESEEDDRGTGSKQSTQAM